MAIIPITLLLAVAARSQPVGPDARANEAFLFTPPGFAEEGKPLWVSGAETGQVQIVVHGTSGSVPGVDIVDPTGAIVAQSTSVSTPTMSGALFLPDAKTGRMLIALPVNKTGTYIVRAQAGSVIASVETSLPLHNVTIKARVTQTNRTSILTYRLGSLEGRTVQFWDTSKGVARRIGKTSKTSGVIRFRQEGNTKARHTITAIVTNHGYAMPRRIVTRYSQSNSDFIG